MSQSNLPLFSTLFYHTHLSNYKMLFMTSSKRIGMSTKRQRGATKVAKTRVSVTMTKPYVETLDSMVEEGVYLSRGEAVLEALRILFTQRGVTPFATA